MRREETFALGAGLTCLAVNLAVVGYFFAPGPRDAGVSAPLVLGGLAYSWLLVAWMLVRTAVVRARRRKRPTSGVRLARSEISRTALLTVVGLGLVLGPVLFAIVGTRFPLSHPLFATVLAPGGDPVAWGLMVSAITGGTLLAVGASVFFAITLLMPLVYRNVRDG